MYVSYVSYIPYVTHITNYIYIYIYIYLHIHIHIYIYIHICSESLKVLEAALRILTKRDAPLFPNHFKLNETHTCSIWGVEEEEDEELALRQ